MPTTVIASEGEILCNIAMRAGFLDCAPVRALPENAALLKSSLKSGDVVTVPDIVIKEESRPSEKRYRFQVKTVPPLAIRFVHGSPDKPYREDFTSAVLNVSNAQTDRGGARGERSFPTRTVFDAAGDIDPDTFKIEIVDPSAGGTIQSELKALKPVYKPDGTVEKHEDFSGAEFARRKNDITCERVPSNVCFRSPYLRLVVDDIDKAAVAAQTLLVTDMADGREGDLDRVEILDQEVHASYERQLCPGSPKCKIATRAPIGTDRRRVKVAIHILQNPDGTPVVNPASAEAARLARQRALNYVRQLYAQANLSLRLVGPIREVPLPANLIAISHPTGQAATGGLEIRIRIRIDTAVDVEAAVTTLPGVPPSATASALAAAIQAVVPGGTKVAASGNPPLRGQTLGSADVLVGDPLTQRVRLNIVNAADPAHTVTIGQLATTTVPDFGGSDSHVGTLEERVLVKNYDTGADRVDLFIVEALGSGALGEAFIPNASQATILQPLAAMNNTALVFADTFRNTDFFHTTIPHEIGHILMDRVHAQVATEMMGPGSPSGSNERVVDGPKRISDPRRIRFDGGSEGVPVTFLRNNNSTLLDGF